MPLWGKTTSDESKPKWLDNVNKNSKAEDCFATESGWVLRHYKGSDKNTARYWDEVLVSIGGLAGAASTTEGLGAATLLEYSLSKNLLHKVQLVLLLWYSTNL